MKIVVTISLALAVASNAIVVHKSPVTLPVARHFNLTGFASLLETNQARAKALRLRALGKANAADAAAVVNAPISNTASSYVANVQVGNPATTYSLLVDTGSANTWAGSRAPYVKTATTVDTHQTMEVDYRSGSFVFGRLFLDQVGLGTLVLPSQGIGAATTSQGFTSVDGILGLGPVGLTGGTISDGRLVPTITDTAFNIGLITAHEVGFSFAPSNQLVPVNNGVLTFGGTDPTRIVGDIHFVPITTIEPASEFIGIQQSITYGPARVPILAQSAGILDTGTTMLLLATDALNRYRAATGAVIDPNLKLLRLTLAQFANLQSLFFNIGGQTFEFTANAQIFPRALNTAIGGSPNFVYLLVGDQGQDSTGTFDFINGFIFHERFYVLYDIAGKRVGIANTPFTNSMIN